MSDFSWLPDFITEQMSQWHVPGVAIGIAHKGETVFARGFGERDRETKKPVTTQTLFGVASTTKAFTAMTLALLVDQKKLEWNTPIREYMPAFALYDDFATQRMTARDLLCHRSGLPRHDTMWYHSPFTRQELFERLHHLEPTADFRTKWQYQNLMYVVAGMLVEKITGDTWEAFAQTHILAPLGMINSNFSVDDTQKTDDFALPYEARGEDIHNIPFVKNLNYIAPAGALNSNINDMLNWLNVHLSQGLHGDTRFVQESTLNTMHTPQMIVDDPTRNELLGEPFVNYGLGWFVQSFRGHQMIYHGGAIDGFSTRAALLPDNEIAIFITCNLDGCALPGIVMYTLCDHILGLDPLNWHQKAKVIVERDHREAFDLLEKSSKARITDTSPSHPLKSYTGGYTHPAYGTINITMSDENTLQAHYNHRVSAIEHYHYDIFDLVLDRYPQIRLKLSFHTNTNGDISQVTVPLQEGAKDIIFGRIAS